MNSLLPRFRTRQGSTLTVFLWQIFTACSAFFLLSLLPTTARANIDFNADGNYDFVFQNQTSGNLTDWLMSGTTYIGGGSLTAPSSGWKLVDSAYLTADGEPDLLFQNQTTGQIAVWSMNGTTVAAATTIASYPASGYQLVGAADFNADGQTDLVFQNSSTGQVAFWFMNNTTYTSGTVLTTTPPTGYQVVGVADFNGDGQPDLVFQNSTGQILFWLMSGTTILTTPTLNATVGSGYQVVGIGDFNGDGQKDLLFQNSSNGQLVYWLLNGTTFNGGSALSSTVASGWQVAGMRSFHSSLSIVNINNNDTLSADVVANVSAQRKYQYYDIKLKVDGTEVAWGGSTDAPGGPTMDPLPFDTDAFANGTHTLMVLDNFGNTDVRTVTFSNQIGNISVSPVFDVTPGVTDVPSTCTIAATLTSSQAWTVTIQSTDATPVTVRTYSGTSASINLIWDGNDATGTEVADSAYDVVIATPQQTRTKGVNKNRVGDCFIILQKDVFPSTVAPGSRKAYRDFIVQKLTPFLHTDFNKLSILEVSSSEMLADRNSTIAARINTHFKGKLNLFYVDSHGGDLPNPYFGIGPYAWYSSNPQGFGHAPLQNFDLTSRGSHPTDINMPNYGGGGIDSPGLVWIDSCDSAGSDGQNDSFLKAFGGGSGGLYGVFLGWGDKCSEYGAIQSSGSDCWDFWRRQFWTQIFVPQNMQTAFANTNSLTTGINGWPFADRPNTRAKWFGVGQTSF